MLSVATGEPSFLSRRLGARARCLAAIARYRQEYTKMSGMSQNP